MTTSASINAFLRFVKSQHAALVNSIDRLIDVLTGEDKDSKLATAATVHERVLSLKAAIASDDHPTWLVELEHCLSMTVSNHNLSYLYMGLARLLPEIRKHEWAFAEDVSVDFDAIYSRYRASSRLPQLFDELIRQFQALIQSPEISDRSAIEALEKLLATLKRNRDGSFFAARGAWEYLITFTKHLAFEHLKQVPVLGPVLSALEATIQEMDEEMAVVHQQVHEEVQRVIPNLQPLLAYDRKGGAANQAKARLIASV